MQRERAADQYPWTWEVPAVVICGIVVVAAVSCQLGRAIANWFAGGGWTWPSPALWFTTLPGLATGNAAAGISIARHATAVSLWVWMTVTCLLGLALSGAVTAWVQRRWGAGELRGVATVADARAVLGVDRLYRVRRIIRPDLYPVRRSR